MKPLVFTLFFIINSLNLFSQFSNSEIIDPNTSLPDDWNTSVLLNGDIDNDGFEDVIYYFSGDFLIFLNDGFGNFNYSITIPSNVYMWEVELFDINNDGYLDIFGGGNNGLIYHLNNGNGTFDNSYVTLYANNVSGFEFGDVNNDGLIDLAVTYLGTQSTIGVYYNVLQAAPSYTSIISSNLPGATYLYNAPNQIPGTILIYDINADGYTDIVYSHSTNENVYAIEGSVNGVFTWTSSPITYDRKYYCSSVIDDVNADGLMDLVSFSGMYNNSSNLYDLTISYQPYSAGNSYTPITIYAPVNNVNVPSEISYTKGYFIDIDNNGLKDAISISDNSLIIVKQSSIAVFDNPITYNINDIAEDFILFDFNNDGDLDIVYANTTNIFKIENVFIGDFRLEGTVFYDANQDGIKNNNEQGFSNWGINSSPNNQSHLTSSEGEYYFSFPKDETNTITLSSNPNWTITTGNYNFTKTLTVTDTIIDSLDFGFIPNNSITDIDPSIIVEEQICDLDATVWVTITNNGTTTPSGIVSLTIDDSLTFVSSNPVPDSVVNNVIYWTYNNLPYFSQLTFEVVVHLPGFNSLGDTMNYEVNVYGDNNSYQNTEPYSNILGCAYDPNDKNVFPKGNGTDGFISTNQTLEYTVRFQNTGNAPATNVIITDQLDSNLDWNSLSISAFSHNVSTEIKPNGQVEFKFLNIMLVDSSVNYSASQGYVVYKINPIQGLIPGDQIDNTANIYFDYNPAIITNNVNNSIICPIPVITYSNGVLDCGIVSNVQWYFNGSEIAGATGQTTPYLQDGTYNVIYDNGNGCITETEVPIALSILKNEQYLKVRAYPNPFNDYVTIEFDKVLEENTKIIITDIYGKIVLEKEVSNMNKVIIEKGSLSSGIYQVFINNTNVNQKILKLSIY